MIAPPSIWSGVFDTWDEATDAAISRSVDTLQAFDTNRWIERQEEMLTSARLGVATRFTNLPMLVSISGARSIVDLGGGSGWTFELVAFNTVRDIENYVIIEQQSSVDAFTRSFIDNDRVRFVASNAKFDVQLESVDVLYSNSALQYFPDNLFLTNLVALCTPDWILLDDLQASSGSQFFSMQHYYGKEIPCRFCDVQSTINELQTLGYSLSADVGYPATIGGSLEPSLSGRLATQNNIGTPRSLLFKVV